jgi:hypothetical protein
MDMGKSRREFLKASALGLAGATLAKSTDPRSG